MDPNAAWLDWKSNPSSRTRQQLVDSVSDRVSYALHKFSRSGVPASVLKAETTKLILSQAKSYNPGAGANFATHVANGLRKLSAFAEDTRHVVRTSDYLRREVPTFMLEKDKLLDRLGREPSFQEMSDHMQVSLPVIKRLNKAVDRKEIGASASQLDANLNSNRSEEDEEDIQLHYYDLKDPQEQLIYEHTFGLFERPQLKPSAISKLSRLPEHRVRKIQHDFAKNIIDFRKGI
jgi:hypothetical protein